MKKLIWGIVIVIVIVLVVVFSNKDNQKEIVIGYIGPLSGPSAVLGMDAIKAIEMAVNEANLKGGVNGKQIKLVSEDDQYLTKNTVSAYQKLVNTDKAKIILVATYGGVFAIEDLAQKDGVVIIDPLDCNAELANVEKNIFCIATETESIGVSLAERMLLSSKTNAAVMYSTKDTFMTLVKNAFEKTFTEKGGKVVEEQFNYDDSDFRTQLSKIKISNPEGLVILGHDEQGIIMKQARDLGINVQFYSTGTITSPAAQQAAAGKSEGTIFAYWEASADNEKAKEFENKFVQLVGRSPILPLTTHPAYDTMTILVEEVLPNITGKITADKVKGELLKVTEYQGTTGIISINQDGAAPIKESVFRLMGGLPVKL